MFFGTHHDLFEGTAQTFLTGALLGGVFGAIAGKTGGKVSPASGQGFGLKAFPQLSKMLKPLPKSPWVKFGAKSAIAGAISTVKYGGKVGYAEAHFYGIDKLVLDSMFDNPDSSGRMVTHRPL